MNELIVLWWIVIIVLIVIGMVTLCFPILLIRLTRASVYRFELPLEEAMNKSISIDEKLFRHHILSGFLIFALSAVALYLLVFTLDLSRVSMQIRNNPFGWQSWLFESLLTIALLGAVLGVCAGLVMMLKPSLYKPLEIWGNRWITTTPESLLDRDLSGEVIEKWIVQHTRLFGVLVLLAAATIWLLVFTR